MNRNKISGSNGIIFYSLRQTVNLLSRKNVWMYIPTNSTYMTVIFLNWTTPGIILKTIFNYFIGKKNPWYLIAILFFVLELLVRLNILKLCSVAICVTSFLLFMAWPIFLLKSLSFCYWFVLTQCIKNINYFRHIFS